MKGHAYRPLYIVIAFVLVVLAARMAFVPPDFGAHEMGYRFGWHRLGNEKEWKDFRPKYASMDYCAGCHPDKVEMLGSGSHAVIPCQNCHGPALDHPEDPKDPVVITGAPELSKGQLTHFIKQGPIDRSRALCLRCHAKLPMKGSGREWIRGIEDAQHNPGGECVGCHNPHKPPFG